MNSVAAFLLFSLIPLAVHGRILYAQAVFRHGDRAPSRNYPNDPYDKSFWPMGWSQLTEKGANETQELGRFLRQKYLQGQVVDNEDQVYVRSSSKTRAIKSAENVLIGLFPDESQRSHVVIEQDTKHWEDQLLKPNSVACPRYDEVRKIENRKNMERLNKKHEAFFAFVSRNAGVNVTMEPRGEGTLGVSDIFNAVYRETQNGFEQPAWVTSEFEPNLTAYDLILELKRVDRLMQFNSPQKSKLRAGFLLGDFVKRLEYAAKRQNKHKLVLYSSHDATLTALLYDMMVSNHLLTPYAAAVIVELHESLEGDHFVRVLYRNDSAVGPYQLHVPGCINADCPLEDFFHILEPRIFRSARAARRACEMSLTEIQHHPVQGAWFHNHKAHFLLLATVAILAVVVLVQGICLFRFVSHKKLAQEM